TFFKMWILVVIGLLSVLVYYKILRLYKYWEQKGISFVKPVPFIGNMGTFLAQKQSFPHFLQDLYNAHPKQRCVGCYLFFQPTLMIRDPELIKQITVKDFDVFPERQQFIPEGIDPLWDKNLFSMKGGQQWQDMRATLSPSFTGSKLRLMFGLMKECTQQLTNYFEKQDGVITVEMKDIFSRFTSDVIASTAFGITCDSVKNPKNEFYAMGRDVTDFTGLRSLIFFINGLSSTLMKLLNIKFIQDKVSTFFSNVIKESVRFRKEEGIIRPDMIHLLLEARKNHSEYNKQNNLGLGIKDLDLSQIHRRPKIDITDTDLTAQALVFFIAGFHTASTLMSFISYELALNPDIQERLREEIDRYAEDCNEDVTYETLLGMKYLDMVVSETLRKWPPLEITNRQSVRNFTIEPKFPGESPVHIDADTSCWIPIYPIQRDPEYFPNPDTFDPERFNDENKKNIKPFTYLPFGTGPRKCIGIRFALLETKLIIFELLRKYEIIPVEQTQIPLVLLKGGLNMVTEKGIWLGFKPRCTAFS
ncbi:hypothetical protein ILUMI_04957, partial [Ignelater luminosus]